MKRAVMNAFNRVIFFDGKSIGCSWIRWQNLKKKIEFFLFFIPFELFLCDIRFFLCVSGDEWLCFISTDYDN